VGGIDGVEVDDLDLYDDDGEGGGGGATGAAPCPCRGPLRATGGGTYRREFNEEGMRRQEVGTGPRPPAVDLTLSLSQGQGTQKEKNHSTPITPLVRYYEYKFSL